MLDFASATLRQYERHVRELEIDHDEYQQSKAKQETADTLVLGMSDAVGKDGHKRLRQDMVKQYVSFLFSFSCSSMHAWI